MGFKVETFTPLLVLALFCSLAWCATSTAETARRDVMDRENTFVFGYTSQVFYNVDPKDVTGLLEVWARIAERKVNNGLKSQIVIYKTLSDAKKALTKNEVDMLIMVPDDFVRLQANSSLVPVLSADYGPRFYNELLLLVREDSGITGIEQLLGKKMKLDVGQQGTIPMKWLDSLLAERVNSNAQKFLGGINECTKASQAVMPVFFRQTDACLVSRSHYETMVELNPQLGRQLRVIERSPGFVTGILAMREVNYKSKKSTDLIKILQDMHNDPKGKQIMTLFRINRLVPFKPEHLASIEKLIRDRHGKTDSLAQRSQ